MWTRRKIAIEKDCSGSLCMAGVLPFKYPTLYDLVYQAFVPRYVLFPYHISVYMRYSRFTCVFFHTNTVKYWKCCSNGRVLYPTLYDLVYGN